MIIEVIYIQVEEKEHSRGALTRKPASHPVGTCPLNCGQSITHIYNTHSKHVYTR